MVTTAITSAVFLLSTLTTALPTLTSRQNVCAQLHIITARGSTEDPGDGTTLGPIAAMIKVQIPTTDSTALEYPAKLLDYFDSEGDGVTALTSALNSYADQCAGSGSKVALLGFSQGAQVILDTLCGTDEFLFKDTPPTMDQRVVGMLSSVVAFGDPSHLEDQSYNRGTGTNDGDFPRQDAEACQPFADIIRSYCNDGDPFCDKGADLDVHTDGAYVRTHGTEAVEWVVSNFNGKPSG